ncbi:MAG: hypothetical protein ACYDC5_13985 [Candidatus Dormibacteria bacterium]
MPELDAPEQAGPNPTAPLGRRVTPGAFDVPNGRAYAVLALSSTIVVPPDFDDPARDQIRALALQMTPNATCVNDTRQFVRYHLLGQSDLALWTLEMTAGPRARLLQTMAVEPNDAGQSLPILDTLDWWTASAPPLLALLEHLGASQLTVFMGFNPYPSGDQPVTDVAFGSCPRPYRATGPGQIPPWGYQFDSFASGSLSRALVEGTLDLIEMFNFRWLNAARSFLLERVHTRLAHQREQLMDRP